MIVWQKTRYFFFSYPHLVVKYVFVSGCFVNIKEKTMKKLIVVSALAFTTLASLATSPKVQASSTAKSAKVSFKQYKKTKKYKDGLTVKYSYSLPQLKGKSAAIKKINKDLLKIYRETSDPSKSIFPSKSTQSDSKQAGAIKKPLTMILPSLA